MKRAKAIKRIFIPLLVIVALGCGSSTGSRYNNESSNSGEKKNEKSLQENFDISQYETKITIGDSAKQTAADNISAWYDYPVSVDTSNDQTTIVNTVNGYRVRVASTDNLSNADTLRSELYSKTNQKNIYIIFDPPFYRIEIGDFTEISSARDLRFKLNQLGYNEARVVNEKVNVYK